VGFARNLPRAPQADAPTAPPQSGTGSDHAQTAPTDPNPVTGRGDARVARNAPRHTRHTPAAAVTIGPRARTPFGDASGPITGLEPPRLQAHCGVCPQSAAGAASGRPYRNPRAGTDHGQYDPSDQNLPSPGRQPLTGRGDARVARNAPRHTRHRPAAAAMQLDRVSRTDDSSRRRTSGRSCRSQSGRSSCAICGRPLRSPATPHRGTRRLPTALA
jgi:hypothetical protein